MWNAQEKQNILHDKLYIFTNIKKIDVLHTYNLRSLTFTPHLPDICCHALDESCLPSGGGIPLEMVQSWDLRYIQITWPAYQTAGLHMSAHTCI